MLSKVVIILDDREFMPGTNPAVPFAPMHDRNSISVALRREPRQTQNGEINVLSGRVGFR